MRARRAPCFHDQQVLLGGPVRVAAYAPSGTAEVAASAVEALAGRSAALLANHGAVTTGATLDRAVENTLLLEWLCAVYRRARCVGRPRALDEEQQTAVVDAALRRRYAASHQVADTPAARTVDQPM